MGVHHLLLNRFEPLLDLLEPNARTSIVWPRLSLWCKLAITFNFVQIRNRGGSWCSYLSALSSLLSLASIWPYLCPNSGRASDKHAPDPAGEAYPTGSLVLVRMAAARPQCSRRHLNEYTMVHKRIKLPRLVHIASDRIRTPAYAMLRDHHIKNNPDWTVTVYNKSQRWEWVQACTHQEIIDAYCALSHDVLRADLWRLLMLWDTGGIYMDDKASADTRLSAQPLLEYGATIACDEWNGMTNWFIAAPPGVGAIGAAVVETVRRIKAREDTCLPEGQRSYSRNGCRFDERVWMLTGPTMLRHVVAPRLGIKLELQHPNGIAHRGRTVLRPLHREAGCTPPRNYSGTSAELVSSKETKEWAANLYRDVHTDMVSGEPIKVWNMQFGSLRGLRYNGDVGAGGRRLPGAEDRMAPSATSYHRLGDNVSLFIDRSIWVPGTSHPGYETRVQTPRSSSPASSLNSMAAVRTLSSSSSPPSASIATGSAGGLKAWWYSVRG